MSELQLGLVVIGALIVIAVFVYNRMQERSARRGAERAFGSSHADILMGTQDPKDDAAVRPAEVRHRAPGHEVSGEIPDPRLDYVMELRSADASVAREFREQWAGIARRLRERALLGVMPDGTLLAGLQLVSRAGVTGEADLIEFRSEVEALAARLSLQVNAPEMKAALEAARAQDAFCADRDIQVALHVVARMQDGFDRATVLAIGERLGMVVEAEGRLASSDSGQRLLFQVMDRSGARLDATRPTAAALLALSLTMDVPRTPETRRSFEAMARAATALGAELDGAIVDDNGAALDERALAAIGAQLDQVRAELDARGIPPGGALALRVFS